MLIVIGSFTGSSNQGAGDLSTATSDPTTAQTLVVDEESGAATTSLSSSLTADEANREAEEADAALDRSCEGWDLVFYDAFAGDSLDPERWNVYDSVGHAGNGLRRPKALTVSDGLLTITAEVLDGELVSGGMGSLHAQTYGRFEARVRTDPDPNEVVSGVVLTWPADNNWPEGGENDFYETGVTADRSPFHTYIHFPDGTEIGSQVEIRHEADATQWHEVAMEWSPDEIVILRNNRFIGAIDDPDVIPDVPHRLTVQLDAIRSAPFEGRVTMEVDWVRIYQPSESTEATVDCGT